MNRKILLIMALSLFFIQCDDSGKKKFIPPFSAEAQQEGTLIVDDAGKVVVTDGTIPEGNTIPVVSQESTSSGNTGTSGDDQTVLQSTPTGDQNSGTSTSGTESTTGTTPTGTENTTATTPSGTESTTEQAPQVPDADPVDNLTKEDSQFAKYDLHSSAGIYWIKDLYQDGKAVFGWEFPPSFTIKVQSLEPDSKVFVTMYGVYPNKETEVFYQYMATKNPSDCKGDGKHHKHHKDKKDHDDHGDKDHGDKDGKIDDDHHGEGGGGKDDDGDKSKDGKDDDKDKDGGKDKEHHGHKSKDHKKCAMKDLEIDGSKWVIVGGKNYKYAYIEFHVLDSKGNDITSTTKAKINVHINGTALTAFLTKIKVHPTPAFIAVTLLLLGIIVGINLLRRKMA